MIAHALRFYRSPILAAAMLLLVSTTLVIISLSLLLHSHDHATIAGTDVPALHCEEDEVFSWTAPDTLGCVHFEDIN